MRLPIRFRSLSRRREQQAHRIVRPHAIRRVLESSCVQAGRALASPLIGCAVGL
jgi:hypothetical protein